MTDERMALIDLIEKQADSDLVREMLVYVALMAWALGMAGLFRRLTRAIRR